MKARKNFIPVIKAYLLTVLAEQDHELENPTEQDLFKYASERFNAEYDYMIKRVGSLAACHEWLLGLALNVDYTYYDIEQLLKNWGVLDGSEDEDTLQDELDQYWYRLAAVLVSNFK